MTSHKPSRAPGRGTYDRHHGGGEADGPPDHGASAFLRLADHVERAGRDQCHPALWTQRCCAAETLRQMALDPARGAHQAVFRAVARFCYTFDPAGCPGRESMD
jgi:hypothetical protein